MGWRVLERLHAYDTRDRAQRQAAAPRFDQLLSVAPVTLTPEAAGAF